MISSVRRFQAKEESLLVGDMNIRPNELRVGKILAGRLALLFLLAAVTLAVVSYIAVSSKVYTIGFPLDDAWIHQTYARNLGQNGEWGFLPGQASAGSTSPLWSALLALGYALGLPYLPWTFLLGGLSLFGTALLGEALLRAYLPEPIRLVPWAGLFLAGEWHLAWAAVSGMETLLNASMILLVFWRAGCARGRAWGWVGVLVGLSVWVRPDGITLIGPTAMILFLTERGWKGRLKGMLWLAGGAALCFVPYLVFNLLVQGSLWPNTFYAKQAEYAAARQLPLLLRYWNELRMPLLGPGLFLLPGFVLFMVRACKRKQWPVLAAGIWFLGYALLYALRLPVVYQYGRYLMPAMPVYFILGFAGSFTLVAKRPVNRLGWLLARVGILSAVLVWLGFFGIGANRFGQDVAIIETEMVASARWIAENTSPETVIAAHDIGAIGYFGRRTLVDLAGLISPEVIPIIRDEEKLSAWLNEKQVDYLVVFEGWYADLPAGRTQVYKTDGVFSLASGGVNMVIYRWASNH